MRHAFSLAILLSHAAFAQTPAKAPEFEVAEIKPTTAETGKRSKPILTGSRVDLLAVTVKSMMATAWGVREDMIFGGPGWLDTDRFDVVAKAAPNTSWDKVLEMFQTLLAERFKLAIRREDRPTPVYALVVAKNPPKLQPPTGERQTCKWNTLEKGGILQRECHDMTMDQLAAQLPRWGAANLDRLVVNLTGIEGAFDFNLEMVAAQKGKDADGHGPSIFDALAHVGLKLEQRKSPASVIVIDRLEHLSDAN